MQYPVQICPKMFALIIFSVLVTVYAQKYNPSELEKKHPGFGKKWIPMGVNPDGSWLIGYLEEPSSEERSFSIFIPEPSEVVTFTLFTRKHPEGTIVNSTDSITQIFDNTKPTKFVTHGWLAHGKSEVCTKIKDGFLLKYDANVFIVDWGEISGNSLYPVTVRATESVGDYYATFLNKLIGLGLDPKSLHLVGHSLGAHVTAFAARNFTENKIGRVTGLDPANPGFEFITIIDFVLNKDTADFVDIIHTTGGFEGIKTSIGHADFFPNGGTIPQPGCESIWEMAHACSHRRSWLYFAESLTSTVPFMAYKCDSYDNFMNKGICHQDKVPMGDPTPPTARGDFYLTTDQFPPFVLEEENIIKYLNN